MMTLCSYQVHGNVATPKGLQHILQAYFFIVSHWLFSPQQRCHYFLGTTTHFAKLTFGASTWFVHFLHTRLFWKDSHTICALTFDCAALVALFHRLGRCACDDDVFVTQGPQTRVEVDSLLQCLRCCRPNPVPAWPLSVLEAFRGL